jgi:hypothetical protein
VDLYAAIVDEKKNIGQLIWTSWLLWNIKLTVVNVLLKPRWP